MDEKIKVKDLAADLGVSTKDLTRVLRELEVEVKSAASTVTPEEAAKAKARLQPEAAAEVMRKEIQPGVIAAPVPTVRPKPLRTRMPQAPPPKPRPKASLRRTPSGARARMIPRKTRPNFPPRPSKP